jgi:hypothetical protein
MAFERRFMTAGIVFLAVFAVAGQEALADNVRTTDKAGFSEVRIPQIKQSIQIGRAPEQPDPKTLKKAGPSPSAPNQPVVCGPDNSQSQTCREAQQSR